MLLFLILATSVTASSQSPATPPEIPRLYTLPELVRNVSLGIVHVASLNRQGKVVSLGSGFVVDPAGVVVTSYHILRGAESAMVKTSDGEVYDRIEVIEYDIRRDLIVLKIRPFSPLHPLRLAAADQLSLGEDVAAVGNPQGLENSVSSGIVAGHRQAEGYRLIQTTAPVSPGSSGSPLLNMHGEVVGLISSQLATERAQNLNFAVPIAYIRPLIEFPSSPVPVAEFTRRMAQSPAAGRLNDGSTPSGATDGGSVWRVLHDHSHFSDTCTGELRIGVDSIGFYSTREPAENWQVHLWQVASARENSLYGSSRRAFHIRMRDDRNFNFVLLTPDGDTTGPTAFLDAVKRARARTVRR
jgi:hypothetical protein